MRGHVDQPVKQTPLVIAPEFLRITRPGQGHAGAQAGDRHGQQERQGAPATIATRRNQCRGRRSSSHNTKPATTPMPASFSHTNPAAESTIATPVHVPPGPVGPTDRPGAAG